MENLITIQNELKVPKGNYNSFGKYKYRSAEDILEAVKPILKTYNALLVLSDEIVQVGNKVFLKATATIKIGDKIEQTFGYAELSEHKGMSSEQATGTASSYARKYALNGLFLIDETEADADSQKPQPKVEQKVEQKKVERNFDAELNALNDCKTLKDLQLTYLSFDLAGRNDAHVIIQKDHLKTILK
jgi:hypothetical protein